MSRFVSNVQLYTLYKVHPKAVAIRFLPRILDFSLANDRPYLETIERDLAERLPRNEKEARALLELLDRIQKARSPRPSLARAIQRAAATLHEPSKAVH